MTKTYFAFSLFLLVVSYLLLAGTTQAAVVPTVSIAGSGGSVQVTVYGDPNAAVFLHYGYNAAATATIGNTDQNGNFSTYLSASSYNLACGNTAYVSVDGVSSATISWSLNSSCTNLNLSQTSVNVIPGQTVTVTAPNASSLVMPTNQNPAVASVTLSGNQISITGSTYGTSNVTVCDPNNNCNSIYINVQTPNSGGISFTQSNLTLNVGQSQAITISGTGGYTVPTNSNSSVASTNINGSTLTVTGLAVGSTNLTVCQSNNQCSLVSVAVTTPAPVITPTVTLPTATYVTGQAPAIASFTAASTDTGGSFLGGNATIRLSFTTNEPVNLPLVTVDGSPAVVSGSGSGPFTFTYTMPSGGAPTLPMVVGLTDAAGYSSHLAIALGALSGPVTVAPPAAAAAPARFNFTTYLKPGATGGEVTELQKRLSKLGFYSGPANGRFGPLTEAAVKKFQAANKLTQLGVVGPATRAILNK